MPGPEGTPPCKQRGRDCVAFILGVIPLVLATGAGAELRQALGTSVFFGILGVTVFGLLFTPVFYVLVRWIGRTRGQRSEVSDQPIVLRQATSHAGTLGDECPRHPAYDADGGRWMHDSEYRYLGLSVTCLAQACHQGGSLHPRIEQ